AGHGGAPAVAVCALGVVVPPPYDRGVVGHVTAPVAVPLESLPTWATLVRAPNPGPMTLDGTNTWVVRAPGAPRCLVVDPGPLDEGHLAAGARSGPVAGVLITHGHPDHVEGLDRFLELTGAAVAAEPDSIAAAGVRAGVRAERLDTAGHTGDSVSFVLDLAGGGDPAVCTGDTIL